MEGKYAEGKFVAEDKVVTREVVKWGQTQGTKDSAVV